MKSPWYILCCVVLLPEVGQAQERYNRWDARPAPNISTISAEERGKKVLLIKARQDSLNAIKRFKQDSLRIIAIASTQTRLQRGVKQRIKDH
ncbi:hypothetical protein [Hymenobacter defluvii]|uniref:Uncharacterized protein n=1 Tax=Hymenobacter defluvii TaxID=2054411 RepID=A0ABS3T817_9BACT|nr:hypothetical protein [Hymenobacter defluvii]MBO3269791.1 hypothetical protein [Hymenobacter defluvii]